MFKHSLFNFFLFTILLINSFSDFSIADETRNSALTAEAPSETLVVVPNECAGIPRANFKNYKDFAYDPSTNSFYGHKISGDSLTQKPIVITSTDKVTIDPHDSGDDSSEAEPKIDPVATINNFMVRQGIKPPCTPQKATPGTKSFKVKDSSCSVAGGEDSYVLSVSWQPGFCEGKPLKPECSQSKFIQPNLYQAKNFTLHGLWPNRKQCGINYGFCDPEHKKQKSFADYPPLELTTETLDTLSPVMPSIAAQSNLEKHEWFKHGTCQSKSQNEYFTYAANLVLQFNSTYFAILVRDNIGQSVDKEDLLAALDSDFGGRARDLIKLSCQGNLLVEVQMPLVKDLTTEKKLSDLFNKDSSQSKQDSCPDQITIDEIGLANETPN